MYTVLCVKEITKRCSWVGMEDSSEEVTFMLRVDDCKETDNMKSKGRDSPKDGKVSVKALRKKWN